MSQHSAGVLFYRRPPTGLEVLLVHPGGPFWRRRDVGAWQIPKGAIDPHEDAATAARREVHEELGVIVTGTLVPLGTIRQAGGKRVEAFAVAQDLDAAAITSTHFSLEWPPRSGRFEMFPEVDAAQWLPVEAARATMLPSQQPLLDRLLQMLARA